MLVLIIADAVGGWIEKIKNDYKKGLQKEDEKALLNSALVGNGLS